jgi:hypothetical protein
MATFHDVFSSREKDIKLYLADVSIFWWNTQCCDFVFAALLSPRLLAALGRLGVWGASAFFMNMGRFGFLWSKLS